MDVELDESTLKRRGWEMKFHETEVDDIIVAAGGTLITDSINKIPQGDGETQRIGREVRILHVLWRYEISLPFSDAQAVAKNGDSVRVILFLDKQCNEATATVTNILESSNIHSFMNLDNRDRFVFIMDKLHDINYIAMGSDGVGLMSQTGVKQQYTFYKEVDILLEFNGENGDIGEIRSNNLGILLCGSNGVAGFDSKIRLRFSS